MSTNVPKISVTADSRHKESYEHHQTSSSSDSEDNSDSNSNDMDNKQKVGGALTDVEDFDSYADVERPQSRRSSKNTLTIPKGSHNVQGDVTDVEDYRDSEADDEDDKSSVYPELKLSLREFLQHDVQEHLLTSDGVKEVVEHKFGNFLQAQNLNAINDYMTDCEDYNTDSEMENNYEKSVCVDFNETFVEQGRVSIADTTVKAKDEDFDNDDYDGISVVSDISDMLSAASEVTGKELHGFSEDEIFELSGNEEICHISCSDSESVSNQGNISEEDLFSSASLPPIDVTFMQTTNRPKLNSSSFLQVDSENGGFKKKMFLEVKESQKEEVLTDIERFDDSVAEGEDSFDGDDDNEQPIPQAVILAVGDDAGSITDCEDFPCDEVSETGAPGHETAPSVDPIAIPQPQREVVELQEDRYGDTITTVMPMDKEYKFGIYVSLIDECVTDTEEYSCTDDLDIQEPMAIVPSRSPSPTSNILVEPDFTITNEVLKPQQSKRLEILSNAESVTDVEEIFMAGTNIRRKKVKTRTITKGKSKYLEAPKAITIEDNGGTDIEDMDLSESGLPVNIKFVASKRQSHHSHFDKVTDIADITADDVSSVSEAELPAIEINTSNFKDYKISSKNFLFTLETCESVDCTRQTSHKKTNTGQTKRNTQLSTHNSQQQQIDIEDVQMPSGAEDYLNSRKTSVDCVCHELNEMLNENCTTVHEKCSNSFNIDAERLHIKGMLRESHTDIEYVESDESAARGSK